MILGFRDRWLEEFFIHDVPSRNIPADLEVRLFRKLQILDDATSDADLRVPPSSHFEKLQGRLAGLHSMRVNDQWRLIFKWNGSRGEADEVYLDSHSYR
jgi:proteic killer suppression protein